MLSLHVTIDDCAFGVQNHSYCHNFRQQVPHLHKALQGVMPWLLTHRFHELVFEWNINVICWFVTDAAAHD